MASIDMGRQSEQVDTSTSAVLQNHERRIALLESQHETIETINEVVGKVWKFLKWGGPTVATALITSGVVNGKWGAFIHALVTGFSS